MIEKRTLGTVATYINGRAFKPNEWETIGLPIIRIQNLTDSVVKYNYSSKPIEEKYKVHKGDLLFAWSASLGAHIWEKGDAWLNQHIFKVIPNNDIYKEYLYYFLFKITAELYAKTHGTGMVHITKAPFMSTPIPVPSFSEQERIVSRIEELFSELDKAVESLQTIKQQLAVYRQAVLKEAFCGKLTNNTIPKKQSLDAYIDKPRYGTSKKCDYDSGAEYTAVIRIPNINANQGIIDNSDLKYAKFDDSELKLLSLEEGDILIIRSNGSVSIVGTAAIIRSCDINKTFAGYLIRLRIRDKQELLPKYLLHFLSSYDARSYIEQVAKSTSGVNNINAQEIGKIAIPIVSVQEQKRIVTEIESRLSVCDSIERTVDKALSQSDALRQSILKQAFEGGLA